MAANVVVSLAGAANIALQNSLAGFEGIAEFAGLENDGVEQEETYILHTMK